MIAPGILGRVAGGMPFSSRSHPILISHRLRLVRLPIRESGSPFQKPPAFSERGSCRGRLRFARLRFTLFRGTAFRAWGSTPSDGPGMLLTPCAGVFRLRSWPGVCRYNFQPMWRQCRSWCLPLTAPRRISQPGAGPFYFRRRHARDVTKGCGAGPDLSPVRPSRQPQPSG
jgi:hypothetical protein